MTRPPDWTRVVTRLEQVAVGVNDYRLPRADLHPNVVVASQVGLG